MKITALLGAVAAASLLFTGAARAADDDNPSGFYLGAGAGRFNLSMRNLDEASSVANRIIHDADDRSWKIFAGYRFGRYFGLEGAYIDLGNPSDTFTGTGSNGRYRLQVSGFAPSVIGRVPIGPVELFAKAGEYYYNVDTRVNINPNSPDISTSHSRNDFLWGGGISGVVIQRLELRAEYEKIEIENAPDSNALWLAAAWRF